MLSEKKCSISKDYGHNTKAPSAEFVYWNRHLLDVCKHGTIIKGYNRVNRKESDEVFLNDLIQIDPLSYTSNWTVASNLYEEMLDMPWHDEVKPSVDYESRTISVNGKVPQYQYN